MFPVLPSVQRLRLTSGAARPLSPWRTTPNNPTTQHEPKCETCPIPYTGSPRAELERCSRGAVWCSRMLYSPSTEPAPDELLEETRALECPQAARPSPKLDATPEAERCALTSSPRTWVAAPPLERARRHEADSDVPQVTQIVEGVRPFVDRQPRKGPTLSFSMSAREHPGEKIEFSCLYNVLRFVADCAAKKWPFGQSVVSAVCDKARSMSPRVGAVVASRDARST